MILALDVGNSQIHGGVFDGETLKVQFRKTSKTGSSSDEIGLFMRTILRENDIDPKGIRQIAVCSVVPDLDHTLRNACKKYFGMNPFSFQPGVKTGLKIKYYNPAEVGSDRIANAIAGTQMFPKKNLIIVDFGTATTYDVITAEKEYLGGLIVPGLRISMEALESNAAKLPVVEIVAPRELVGRSAMESIQSGLYYSNLHALQGIAAQIRRDYFNNEPAMVIGTGGFSRMFEREKLFDALVPELVLLGLLQALRMNA